MFWEIYKVQSACESFDICSKLMHMLYGQVTKKMGDFIEPGTHRSTIIKVKIETLLKKSEMYFSYCIESKDFIYAFSNCSVK